MSIIGEAALSAFFQTLFDKFSSLELLNIVRDEEVHAEMKKWEKMLKNIHAVLDDAEEKQIQNKQVKSWLSELKDLAYDVEDILDEFSTKCLQQKLMREPPPQATSRFSKSMFQKLIPACCASLSSFSPQAVMFNTEMMSKIEEITTRLQDIGDHKKVLDLAENVRGTSRKVWQRSPTTCLPDEPVVYGRYEDKKKILGLLLRYQTSDAKIGVVPIVGMGGVGKTTLTQLVYNDKVISEYFDVRAWTCVSDVFDVMRITKGILESITSRNCDLKELNQVQLKLHNELAGKRFLIVLDDVWNDNYSDWHALRSPFMDGAPGSKVIVTTRSTNIAQMMGTVEYHDLKCIQDDDCWLLFARHAFENRSVAAHPNLEIIGRKIVDTRCGGLPLAARALGGLLRSKQREDEWREILNSKIWSMQDDSNILPVLRLSYHYLPSHLKRCFAYCAILPKDYEFEEKELVLLWMAEGLIQQRDDEKDMEDLGSDYFCELLARSIYQVSSNDKSRCIMHDLINDLAKTVAEETCFRLEDEIIVGSKRARHCSHIQGHYDGLKKFEPFCNMKVLRTFLPLSLRRNQICFLANNVPGYLLRDLRCLRVLSFKRYKITELPNSVGDLKHLRYLDLSYTEIINLPESTTSLYNLQTLMLEGCSLLEKLPTEMGNLINLRHLDISGVDLAEGMPLGMQELKALRTLSDFVVGNAFSITTLMSLNSLQGELCISRLENVMDSSYANLKDKEDISALSLIWSGGDGRDELLHTNVLEGLQPHGNLKNLTVRYYGGAKFPPWLEHPTFYNLVVLKLEDCTNCTSLPQLGSLPSLKDLFIARMSKVQMVDQEFYGDHCQTPFPALEILCFQGMDEWEEWNPCQVEFPRLRELSIGHCCQLSGKLPSHLSSLEKLVIRECPKLTVSYPSLPILSSLEISGCKEVDCRYKVDFSSLISVVFSDISIFTNLAAEFMEGLKKFKKLILRGNKISGPAYPRVCSVLENLIGYPQFLDTLECVFVNSSQLISMMVDEDHQQLQQELAGSELEMLTLIKCSWLKKLPPWIHNLMFLRELTLEDCPRLVSFPETSLLFMLKVVRIKNCDALAPLLGPLICNSRSLEELEIKSCDSLISFEKKHLPPNLKRLSFVLCKMLESLLGEEDGGSSSTSQEAESTSYGGNASTLEFLSIFECPRLTSLSTRGCQLPATLKHLHVAKCSNLSSLSSRGRFPHVGKLPPRLQYLSIRNCSKLESIADRVDHNTSLESISICNCSNLESLPEGLRNLINLRQIKIDSCALVSLPRGGFPTTSLKELEIQNCEKLEALPDNIHKLSSLQEFRMCNCPSILSFPTDGFPTSLTLLEIVNLKINKPLFRWGLHRIISLKVLDIKGGCSDIVSFPQDDKGMVLPSTITKLSIKDFPNLVLLSTKGFQNLNSLEALYVLNCPKLNSFPLNGLPASMLELHISRCPLLENRCEKGKGQEWFKIAHIPYINIRPDFSNY